MSLFIQDSAAHCVLLAPGGQPCSHAYGQGAPNQENHPTSANLAPPAFLNNSHFAFSLYRRMVAANPGKNIVFSPLSFSIRLTLLALQAGPAACTQVLEALGFPLTQVPGHGVHARCSQQLLASLLSLAACQPHMGSILFVDERQPLAQRFVDIAQNLHGTEVFLIPFGSKQVAGEQMDPFASKMTHYEIRKLAQELTPDTVLILANYIFFKGKKFPNDYLGPPAVCCKVHLSFVQEESLPLSSCLSKNSIA